MTSILSKLFGSSSSLTMQQIYDLVHRDKATLLDVRSYDEYRKGHVSNSLNIPIDELSNRISEISKTHPIIVYCASGGRSSMAQKILKDHGFENIHNAKIWEEVSAALDRRK